jgi:site-specific DNA recombinase
MRAAIYIRVSTEEQAEEGYSLAAQDRACRAYAESQGWSVVDVFADEGISGTKDAGKRPQLARLLTGVRNGTVEAIIVHKLDRLARSVRLTMELIEEFQRR